MSKYSILIAKRSAQVIIKDFGITDPSDISLDFVAVDRGIFPREAPLQGCDARLLIDVDHSYGIATISSVIPEIGRKRFALAHEIGHFELHRADSNDWKCSESDFLKSYKGSGKEPEANAFAAELLMPEDMFMAYCTGRIPCHSNISEIAGIFNTSYTSTAIRYVEKGNHPCALLLSRDSKISWFWASHDFPYRVLSRGSKINPNSCAGDFFSNNSLPPKDPERVPAFLWLEDTGTANTSTLYENSFAIPRYNTVLTIIWED